MRSVDKIKWKIEPVRYLDGKRLCLSLSISYSVYPISFLSFDSWNERCFCFSFFFCFSFSFIVFWSISQKTVLCNTILQRYIYMYKSEFHRQWVLLHSHIYRNYFWMHSNISLSLFLPETLVIDVFFTRKWENLFNVFIMHTFKCLMISRKYIQIHTQYTRKHIIYLLYFGSITFEFNLSHGSLTV